MIPDHVSLPVEEIRRLLAKPPDMYEGLTDLEAWRLWFAPSAAEWAKVECIECELDRHCLKDPPCAGAYLDDCEICRGEIFNGTPHVCAGEK